jgi:hypothetical protein
MSSHSLSSFEEVEEQGAPLRPNDNQQTWLE